MLQPGNTAPVNSYGPQSNSYGTLPQQEQTVYGALKNADCADAAENQYASQVDQDILADTKGKTEEEELIDDVVGFVKKVLGIVAGQMVLTVAVIVYASYSDDFGQLCASDAGLGASVCLYLFSILALFCSRGLRHSVPMNYIVLAVWTLSMAWMIGGITYYLTVKSVLMAVGTLAIILCTLFFSMFGLEDIEKSVMRVLIAICAAMVIQLAIMIPLAITGSFVALDILYCSLGIVLSCLMIYIDIFRVMIIGAVARDEYILGAILLYIDIIRLLYWLLLAFAKRK